MQISFHYKRSPALFDYRLVGSSINVANEIRDLGIILPSDFSFKSHIETICAKDFKYLGFTKRNWTDMNYTSLKESCIRICSGSVCLRIRFIHLESSIQIGLIDKIDQIQRSFIRMIAFKLNVCSLHITEVENQCKLSPLGRSLKYFDCLFLYKLLNGTVNCPELLSRIGLKDPSVNYNL